MTLAAVLILFAVVLAQVGPLLRNRFFPSVLRRRYRSTVVVTLKSGAGFKGIVAEADSEAIVLRNAEALAGGTTASVIVDGELIVLRADILYLQRP